MTIGNTSIIYQDMLIRPWNDFVYSNNYQLNGTTQDVTNYAGFMQFRSFPGLPKLLFQASTNNGMISFGNTDGLFTISIPYDKTGEMQMLFTSCYYDLVFVTPSNIHFTYMQGKVIIDQAAVTNINDSSTALI